jgi:hypothetical protein
MRNLPARAHKPPASPIPGIGPTADCGSVKAYVFQRPGDDGSQSNLDRLVTGFLSDRAVKGYAMPAKADRSPAHATPWLPIGPRPAAHCPRGRESGSAVPADWHGVVSEIRSVHAFVRSVQ